MSFKKVLFNTRGEAASLVILVSMIVVTLGVLTGTRLLQDRVKTSSRASTGPTITTSFCSAQCESLGYDFGTCSSTNTCNPGTAHPDFMCTSRSVCCCGYNPTTPTATNTLTPTYTPTPTPYQFTMTGYVKYENNLGAEGIVVKLYKYGTGTNPPKDYYSEYTTDNTGRYVFNVPTGTYDVQPQSSSITTISPAMQTVALLAAPFTIDIPLFTASGNPTPTLTPLVTNTPVPTLTSTPTITASPMPSTTSVLTPSISPIPTGTLSCISLLRADANSTIKLTLTAGNASNPFYAILQKDGTTILQGVSNNPSTITFTLNNLQPGKYKGFVSTSLNGFYKSSNTCEYIYGITTTPPITSSPTVTGTITVIPSLTVTTSISPIVNPSLSLTPSPTKIPMNCAKKSVGDADCQKDKNNATINILDYAIWYSEFVRNCSSENLAGCGADADGNGDPMDANFNYPGTKYISTDMKVTVFDYAVWIQGFVTENPTTPTPTLIVTTVTMSQTPTPMKNPTITSLPPITKKGIWISTNEIMQRPTSGPEWERILKIAADASVGGARISNQDSNHDVQTLAMALVCVSLGKADMCTKAKAAVVSAIDTEEGGRWLAVGRNLGAYVISADLLNLYADDDRNSPGSRVNAWLYKVYTRTLPSNNDANVMHTFRQSAWSSGSNASAQEGFAYAALSAYLKDSAGLEWSWNAYNRYVGNRRSSHYLTASDMTWQLYPNPTSTGAPANKDAPVGIQDAGAKKNDCRLDGAISEDMAEGGTFSCTPAYTQYPWMGLEGAVPTAVVLQRAGYPAFAAGNNALLRATDYLWSMRQKTGNSDWFNGTRSNEIIHLINIAYNKSFILNKPVSGGGRTIDYTLWTHPAGL